MKPPIDRRELRLATRAIHGLLAAHTSPRRVVLGPGIPELLASVLKQADTIVARSDEVTPIELDDKHPPGANEVAGGALRWDAVILAALESAEESLPPLVAGLAPGGVVVMLGFGGLENEARPRSPAADEAGDRPAFGHRLSLSVCRGLLEQIGLDDVQVIRVGRDRDDFVVTGRCPTSAPLDGPDAALGGVQNVALSGLLELEQWLTDAESALASADLERTVIVANTARLEATLAEQRQGLLHAREEVAEKQSLAEARSGDLRALHDQFAEAEADRVNRLRVIDEQTGVIADRTLRLAESERDRQANVDALEAHVRLVRELYQRRTELSEATEELSARLAEAQADATARLTVIEELSDRLAALHESYLVARRNSDLATHESARARHEQAALSAQLADRARALAHSQQTILERELVIGELRAGETGLKLHLAETSLVAESRVAALQEELAGLNAALDDSRSRLNETAQALNAAEDRTTALERALEASARTNDRLAEATGYLSALRVSRGYRLLRMAGRWRGIDADIGRFLSEATMTSVRAQRFQRVVVDLTPMVPGGHNGGAKLMTLELIRQLARLASELELVLLVADDVEADLATVAAPNVRSVCVLQRAGAALAARPALAVGMEAIARRSLKTVLPAAIAARARKTRDTLFRAQPNRLLRELGADLLFCPFTSPYYADPSIPTVAVIYDIQHRYYPEFFSPSDRQDRDRFFGEACNRASHVVCISDFVRATVLENSSLPPDRVSTVHIRMPNRLAEPSAATSDSPLANLGFGAGRYLLYPANFWVHKNHEMLLTALGMFFSRHPDSDLGVVFSGEKSERLTWLLDAVDVMGLSSRVKVVGYLPDSDFAEVLHGCRAVVFPSLFEGFGMPILEAMAAGRPVLCGDSTSLPEVAAGAALSFDARRPACIVEALERLEYEDGVAESLIEAGRQRAAAFGSPSRMASEYLRLFRSLVDRGGVGDAVAGIEDDGWSGDRIVVTHGAALEQRTLELELYAPPWLPRAPVSVSRRDRAGISSRLALLDRGSTAKVQVPLPSHAGTVEFRIEPTFQPSTLGLGDDSRVLGVVCQSTLIANGHEVIDLLRVRE